MLAPRAAADPSAGGNPLPLDAADYADLYRRGAERPSSDA